MTCITDTLAVLQPPLQALVVEDVPPGGTLRDADEDSRDELLTTNAARYRQHVCRHQFAVLNWRGATGLHDTACEPLPRIAFDGVTLRPKLKTAASNVAMAQVAIDHATSPNPATHLCGDPATHCMDRNLRPIFHHDLHVLALAVKIPLADPLFFNTRHGKPQPTVPEVWVRNPTFVGCGAMTHR
eukprot:CAMPEP_0117506276 /NCGR_PEP_ID=MMETSP0784-20121206/25825_1 /TAXON_ID=39447 /ORGANISM="" /LENGTH=184 /DNA_ID=CAMNT_0005301745 /DNA_START=208 /DNA_END=763 /DNA_ORIENTATION=+